MGPGNSGAGNLGSRQTLRLCIDQKIGSCVDTEILSMHRDLSIITESYINECNVTSL